MQIRQGVYVEPSVVLLDATRSLDLAPYLYTMPTHTDDTVKQLAIQCGAHEELSQEVVADCLRKMYEDSDGRAVPHPEAACQMANLIYDLRVQGEERIEMRDVYVLGQDNVLRPAEEMTFISGSAGGTRYTLR